LGKSLRSGRQSVSYQSECWPSDEQAGASADRNGGWQETVKGISVRYAGHFDDDLFEEIRKLNPDLKDPDHLEDGQLIRIPLQAATAIH
jgi:hypothetical protein